jgi:hypothetical protein
MLTYWQESTSMNIPGPKQRSRHMIRVLADDAERFLSNSEIWKEKFLLGGALFYDDITITP